MVDVVDVVDVVVVVLVPVVVVAVVLVVGLIVVVLGVVAVVAVVEFFSANVVGETIEFSSAQIAEIQRITNKPESLSKYMMDLKKNIY